MGAAPAADADPIPMDRWACDDRIAGRFVAATIVWGLVGMLAGVWAALELAAPALNFEAPMLTFGRLRPVHTNVLIFGFAGNAIFAAVYYSAQRLLKVRLPGRVLGHLHFWCWQAGIAGASITLPLRVTQGKEYAEPAWPLDIAFAAAWLCFAINFFVGVARRRQRHLYVSLWFYLAAIIAVFVLHVVNNLALPAGAMRSYSLFAGARDALVQWWYGFGIVVFLLTMPLLGAVYYFLPKAAGKPLYSRRLAIVHFWSLVILALLAGAHHLHHTAAPAWLAALGTVFSIMLWMPALAGVINGLLTLRGAGEKIAEEPALKFFIAALVFYGISAFEGPILSVGSVNALAHYTNWPIAHVHIGGLGWVGLMVFGLLYWLAPRLFQADLFSRRLAGAHLWIAAAGALMWVFPIYTAGVLEGLMWRATDSTGSLVYGGWLEITARLTPLYWIRALGGVLYLIGASLCLANLLLIWRGRPAVYDEPVQETPPLPADYVDPPPPASRLENVIGLARALDRLAQGHWHRRWERLPGRMAGVVVIVIALASLVQIAPMLLIRSNVPTIDSVRPYTPLELAGRDIYLAEGCFNCHSQMIRPMPHETQRFGSYSLPGEFIYDHPFQWGSRRIGPDLHRIGRRNTSVLWHVAHLRRPGETSEGTLMPAYHWLLEEELNVDHVQSALQAMAALGVPYETARDDPAEAARRQARELARRLAGEDATYEGAGLEDRKIIALVAYLLRLGTDIGRSAPDDEDDDHLIIGSGGEWELR
jgi:cytochrome c oxidase cbb3-type subunit I/II